VAADSKRVTVCGWVLLFGWCAGLTLLVYGRSLTLPFFFDDLVLLPYVAETTLAQLWREPAIFPYFRPLPPTFWRLSYLAWGGHQPVWLHGWNLLLHALNAWLIGYLAVRLLPTSNQPATSNRLLPFLSAALYLLFPFHFQAVPWITAVYHLAVTTFILASVAAYLRFRQSGRWRWAWLGGLAALAGLFTQETAVLILPLILALELFSGDWRNKSPLRAVALKILPWAMPLLLWLPFWLLTPRTTSELGLNNLETIGQNAAWIMQGVAFPFTWVGGWLRAAQGWNDLATAVFLSLLAVAVLLLGQWRGGGTRLGGYAWAWIALACLPVLLLLPFAYLLSSPRLLTVTAVGAAWLWGDLLARLAGRAAFARLLAVALLLLAVVPAWGFLQGQMRFHTMLGDLYWQLAEETVAANEMGKTAIAINFPADLNASERRFALGHEGVIFVAVYIPIPNIVSAQTGHPAQLDMLRYDDTRPELPYLAGVLGEGQNWPALVEAGDDLEVFDSRYGEAAIMLAAAGSWPEEAASDGAMGEFSAEGLATPVWLEGVGITAVANSLRVDMTWRIAQPPPYSVTVFVHALNAAGELVAQADGYPWARTYPMGQWPPGAVVGDTRFIPSAEPIKELRIGLYNNATGERLTLLAAEGLVGPDNQIRLEVDEAE
jgi:protein O-mannosyl-transferase